MLISNAYAAAPAAFMAPDLMGLPFFAIIFVLFYFMMIRPQTKRAKDQRSMISALQKGDEVITLGGELGKVMKVSDNYVSLEIAANVVVQVQKQAIQTLLPKGTIKGIN